MKKMLKSLLFEVRRVCSNLSKLEICLLVAFLAFIWTFSSCSSTSTVESQKYSRTEFVCDLMSSRTDSLVVCNNYIRNGVIKIQKFQNDAWVDSIRVIITDTLNATETSVTVSRDSVVVKDSLKKEDFLTEIKTKQKDAFTSHTWSGLKFFGVVTILVLILLIILKKI